ncbi:MAG: PilZ domain-containing protein [Mariniblastus sp.]|nr:PilZ domain-containing protein [Mariniblastus sp.]
MDDKQRETRRSHYRLRYPPASQPTIQIGNDTYQVAEISEAGARIVLEGTFSIAPSEAFAGDVVFHDGESISIEGSVLRTHGNEVAVQLSKGISIKRMLAEQIWLRKEFPMFFDSVERARERWRQNKTLDRS